VLESHTTWNDLTVQVDLWDMAADELHQTLTVETPNPHPDCSVQVEHSLALNVTEAGVTYSPAYYLQWEYTCVLDMLEVELTWTD